MPLPLPNLDTRRWDDLVEEGRALIPRYAPTWTDHNIHDPGITLMELLAWLVEQDIYRVNRVPDRHRRKFLALVGFPPRPPQPAWTVLHFSLAAGATSQAMPAGMAFATPDADGERLRFLTRAPLTVVPAAIAAVQTFDGQAFVDQTRLWQDGLPFDPWGPNPQAPEGGGPEEGPAFYLGLDQALPVGEKVSLWLWFASGRSDMQALARLMEEATQQAAACLPQRPMASCTPAPSQPGPPTTDPWCPPESQVGAEETSTPDSGRQEARLPPHHSVRSVWEYFDGAHWQALDPESAQVQDHTRVLTLDGPVHFTLPAAMAATETGKVNTPLFYLRCRVVAGRPDIAPRLGGLALNAVAACQAHPVASTLPIAPGVTPPAGQEPVPGEQAPLRLNLNDQGEISALAFGDDVHGPRALVIDYQAATVGTPGALTTTLALAGYGSGLPGLELALPAAQVSEGDIEVWVGLERWEQRPDLDASGRVDAHFTLDPTTGRLAFGDGEHGRLAPDGAPVLVAYRATSASRGNLPPGGAWNLSEADEAYNQALLGGPLTALADALESAVNPLPARMGADEEILTHAAGRAAETLWAHERLLELCEDRRCNTLDQVEQEAVLERLAPGRATTLLDFERLALEVPGTWVSRARAWAGLDTAYPCLKAPGTVSVVVLPALPVGKPEPTAGLLAAVQAYLDRRRIIGTRLLVVGPQYLEVTVKAQVQAREGADPARVQHDIRVALEAFLDPLTGGPQGLGWPFGRDVYRSEILQVIDEVPGVDHVLSLELIPGEGEAQCGNLCLGPNWLVTAGNHAIVVTH